MRPEDPTKTVLGVWVTGKAIQSADLPFAKNTLGVYFNQGTDMPDGCVYVVHLGNAQFAMGTPGTELLYFRVKEYGGTTWRSWKRITLT